MYDATHESPEGGYSPKIGVTPEFMDSFKRLREYLIQKHGPVEGQARLEFLARYFQETMDDHKFVDKFTGTDAAKAVVDDLMKTTSFKS